MEPGSRDATHRTEIWDKTAAELGDASGQYNLAVMCFKGRGINPDKELAIFWCKKALMKIGVDWT